MLSLVVPRGLTSFGWKGVTRGHGEQGEHEVVVERGKKTEALSEAYWLD